MARRLFGTDGVRGVAGTDITAALAHDLGRAAVLATARVAPRVLVVRDTRESGEMLEAAIAEGLASAGAEVLLGGVLPTPAAPLLVRRHGLDLAVVLSASHNVYSDNGIKFFGGDGFKLSDEAEQLIEARLDESAGGSGEQIGRIRKLDDTAEDYLGELHRRFESLSLHGLDVLLDCANGATYLVAPAIFERLGASVSTVAAEPDGRNINDRCGSTHIERIAEQVVAAGHDIGFAFDGDGDRVLAVDRAGTIVDGDEMVMLIAHYLLGKDRLPGRGVAITVMTNFAFVTALRAAGIEVASTAVGDRYVLEELRQRGWTLGGEQSGHIIELGFAPSGDGIASALLLLEALAGADLDQRRRVRKLPQRLVNVPVRDRVAAQEAPAVREAIARESGGLEGRGRVLVRPSGTEPLVRVMVEAPSAAEADEVCARLVAAVESAVG
ncbi:MAG: phosphoglucosamine mutase [Solirubrobacteraceae bacterium]|jgi:phosphoglucosamine mutase